MVQTKNFGISHYFYKHIIRVFLQSFDNKKEAFFMYLKIFDHKLNQFGKLRVRRYNTLTFISIV